MLSIQYFTQIYMRQKKVKEILFAYDYEVCVYTNIC